MACVQIVLDALWDWASLNNMLISTKTVYLDFHTNTGSKAIGIEEEI